MRIRENLQRSAAWLKARESWTRPALTAALLAALAVFALYTVKIGRKLAAGGFGACSSCGGCGGDSAPPSFPEIPAPPRR